MKALITLLMVALLTSVTLWGYTACTPYKASGPVVVTRDNQVISNLRITAKTGPGITILGHSGVRINNVVVLHQYGPGIQLKASSGVTISNADIVFTGAKPSGPNPSADFNNIDCYHSPNLTVNNVRVTRGSTGIYLNRCHGSRLKFIEGHDQRGPFPRGQLVQWDGANDGLLEDFSNETSLINSWPEDNLNMYWAKRVIIRRGLIDGNNAPYGDAVMIDEKSSNALVEDVDAVHQGNGCFGIWGGGDGNVTFRNTRCRDTVCKSVRGKLSSGSLAWTVDPRTKTGNLHIVNATYANVCNPTNIVWEAKSLTTKQITQQNFTPRKPLRVKLCQYGY
jgi:hypothetical protein